MHSEAKQRKFEELEKEIGSYPGYAYVLNDYSRKLPLKQLQDIEGCAFPNETAFVDEELYNRFCDFREYSNQLNRLKLYNLSNSLVAQEQGVTEIVEVTSSGICKSMIVLAQHHSSARAVIDSAIWRFSRTNRKRRTVKIEVFDSDELQLVQEICRQLCNIQPSAFDNALGVIKSFFSKRGAETVFIILNNINSKEKRTSDLLYVFFGLCRDLNDRPDVKQCNQLILITRFENATTIDNLEGRTKSRFSGSTLNLNYNWKDLEEGRKYFLDVARSKLQFPKDQNLFDEILKSHIAKGCAVLGLPEKVIVQETEKAVLKHKKTGEVAFPVDLQYCDPYLAVFRGLTPVGWVTLLAALSFIARRQRAKFCYTLLRREIRLYQEPDLKASIDVIQGFESLLQGLNELKNTRLIRMVTQSHFEELVVWELGVLLGHVLENIQASDMFNRLSDPMRHEMVCWRKSIVALL